MRLRFARHGFLLSHLGMESSGLDLWLMSKRNPSCILLTHQPYLSLWSFVSEFPTSLPREIFKHKHVVDVGSYIGDSVIYFLRWCSSKKVSAYEPHPVLYRLLQRNVYLNGLNDYVTSINKAVASTRGKRHFKSEGRGSRFHEEGEFIVDTENFERIVSYTPDIAKLDCEGCEHEIVNNTPKKSIKEIGEYVVEVHGRVPSFISIMKSYGYCCRLLSQTYSPVFGRLATIYFKRA